ncbi:MAG: radical SAM protein [Candidatus Aenigmarchaeota archaeon]|nr:radical SAM protein [Candidatus Aenigmarchaeota archaeon]
MRQIIIPRDADLPLMGCIAFGIIDRSTNLLQIRPTSICCLNCIFCSVDLGPKSRTRETEYIVDCDYLLEWAKEIARFKGNYKLQMHIDFGEPTTYPKLIYLVQGLKEIKGVEIVSMETKALLLNEGKIDELAEAGLSRINLSVDSLDPELARKITGTQSYDVIRIKELAEYIAKRMDLLITPVWVPGLNDEEIPKIIEFAKEIGSKLGIQKYEAHKYGRKPRGIRPITWWKFYRKLEEWEEEHSTKLKIKPQDFGIHKRKMVPTVFEKGERVRLEIRAPGWMRNEMIGVAKDRCVTVFNCKADIGDEVRVRILENKHNLYVAENV